jgi:carbon-monoxide dehydrogenase medium subunit
MIPQTFEYSAPSTLAEALQLLESGDTKILAGGMSLIPLMKLRLAQPEHVVDLGRVPELNNITASAGTVNIGAMATHHEVATSAAVRGQCPLLAEAAASIGDPQIRNMGTIGGSIAHADPAADYPAALLALDAQVRIASAKGERTVTAEEFFVDAFSTAIEPGEIVVEVQVSAEAQGEGYKYEKVEHPASGFAVVGVAVRIQKSAGKITLARVAVTGLSGRAFRAHNVEQALEAGNVETAAANLGEGIEPNSDMYASGEYRLHLARIHAARAIAAAISRTS